MIVSSLIAVATPPPSDPTTTYVILGAAGLFIIYVMQRMAKKKPRREPETSFFTKGSLAKEREAEQAMESVLVEFSKMSRELSAQLDTRAVKLEVLIADADERIARLDTLLRQAPARPDFTTPAVETFMRLAQSAASSPAAAEPVRVTDDMAPSPSIDPGHAEVYRLADEGRNVQQIASELARPSGEVELILALRSRS